MSGSLHRREVVAGLLAGRDENLLVVSGLGSSCWDVAAAGDVPQNFYVWGAMGGAAMIRSEEHTSELQSLMRIPYAVFCLKTKNTTQRVTIHNLTTPLYMTNC